MLPPIPLLRNRLLTVIACKEAQGHETAGLREAVKALPESYDALSDFAEQLRRLPMRPGWPYEEPNTLEEILEECPPDRPSGALSSLASQEAGRRVESAFLGSVCGCMLGKPLEVDPTLEEIRKAAEAVGAWPIRDYIPEALLRALGRRHGSWEATVREKIAYVAPDDDINYTLLGMQILEDQGLGFTRHRLAELWLRELPALWTWGPERTFLIKGAIHSLGADREMPLEDWVETWNPEDEACGAAIRVDAYGYACPGRPALAAELAWRDSSMTHRRTGIYGSMFIAAAIATAFVAPEPMEIFETALKFVPRRSRFHEIVSDCLRIVSRSTDWLEGYQGIHAKYGTYGHCRLYQECGLLINSARFSRDVADAFCMQVSQGCDTDCFGRIAGSIMGAYFGPGHLDDRWIRPFRDDLRTSLGLFHQRSLSAVARRIAALPRLTAA